MIYMFKLFDFEISILYMSSTMLEIDLPTVNFICIADWRPCFNLNRRRAAVA